MKAVVIFVLGFTLVGCSKSIEDTLLNNQWRIDSIQAEKPVDSNMDGTKSTDIKSQNPKCMWDDVFFFKEQNVLIMKEGDDICSTSIAGEGSWEIDGNDLILSLPYTAPIQFKIVTFDASKFVAETQTTKIKYIYTFVKN